MNAVLALEDGTWFRGTSVGAAGETSGEVVFNTSMTGYQEILTDPSYAGQIVTMTSVQIGNYGVTADDTESRGPQVAGFIMRESSPVASNWRADQSAARLPGQAQHRRHRGCRYPRPDKEAAIRRCAARRHRHRAQSRPAAARRAGEWHPAISRGPTSCAR